MEENSLDSLVTENTSQKTTGNFSQENTRPKLRKIKRPKQRTTPEVPASPAKIMPEEVTVGDLNIESLEEAFSGIEKEIKFPSFASSIVKPIVVKACLNLSNDCLIIFLSHESR